LLLTVPFLALLLGMYTAKTIENEGKGGEGHGH
jgi:hypothetical protein